MKKKIYLEGKKDIAKKVHQTITRGCKLWFWKQQFKESLESMLRRVVIFP